MNPKQHSHKTQVVIAGGGTAGWMAAAAMSRLLGKSLNITLVESEEIGTVGVGEATIPPIRTFHKLLGIDEQAFVKATNATFKLGIQFENWRQTEQDYIHSFGMTGKECWAGEFHHFWLRGQEQGIETEFADFCLELQAAKAGKFALSQNPQLNFAYHLDATAYAGFMRQFAERHGVTRREGKIARVHKHPDGSIASLELHNGENLRGDFFVDCTGFRGVIIEQALHTGYEDWGHWLPCDRAIAVQTERTGPPPPYTRAIAREFGWQWRIPLQHRVGNGLVYCSRYATDGDAQDKLLTHLQGETITEPRLIGFRPGRRRKGWHKNCVALGLASGFVEPLESTSIHLIMTGIIRLLRLFPFDGLTASAEREYNQKLTSELNCILDFIVLHYKVTERSDSPFWQHCQAMEIPDSLAHKIQLFKDTGRVFLDDGDIFRVDSWTQVMLGQGLRPAQYHQVAAEMEREELQRFLLGMKQAIRQAVDKLPAHDDFIKQHFAAPVVRQSM